MQFSLITILGLAAVTLAAPVASPDAAPEALAEASPVESIFARTSSPSQSCCPKGKHSSCSPCPSSGKCPSDKPDKYSGCIGVGLINVVVCNVLNGNTVSIPITLDLLSS